MEPTANSAPALHRHGGQDPTSPPPAGYAASARFVIPLSTDPELLAEIECFEKALPDEAERCHEDLQESDPRTRVAVEEVGVNTDHAKTRVAEQAGKRCRLVVDIVAVATVAAEKFVTLRITACHAVTSVGYRDEETTTRSQDAPHFPQRFLRVRCVLQDVLHDHQLELAITERQRLQRTDLGSEPQGPTVIHRLCPDINSSTRQAKILGRQQGMRKRTSDVEQRTGVAVIEQVQDLVPGFLDPPPTPFRISGIVRLREDTSLRVGTFLKSMRSPINQPTLAATGELYSRMAGDGRRTAIFADWAGRPDQFLAGFLAGRTPGGRGRLGSFREARAHDHGSGLSDGWLGGHRFARLVPLNESTP